MTGIFRYIAIHCIIASCGPKRRSSGSVSAESPGEFSGPQQAPVSVHRGTRLMIDHPIAGWYGDRKSSHPPYQDHNVSIHGLGQLDYVWENLTLTYSGHPGGPEFCEYESTLASFIMFHSKRPASKRWQESQPSIPAGQLLDPWQELQRQRHQLSKGQPGWQVLQVPKDEHVIE